MIKMYTFDTPTHTKQIKHASGQLKKRKDKKGLQLELDQNGFIPDLVLIVAFFQPIQNGEEEADNMR